MEHDPISYKLDQSDNSGMLIRYHYENFILRIGKVKDLLLILINQVMMLGIKRGTNMEPQVLREIASSYNFITVWNQVKEQMDPIRPYRNHLAHNGTMQHEDLNLLNMYYSYGNKYRHQNLIDKFRSELAMSDVQHELVEKFTSN